MTNIRRTSDFIPTATASPSFDDEIINLLQTPEGQSEVLQMLGKMPQPEARALLERLKNDNRLPAETLNKIREFSGYLQPSQDTQGPGVSAANKNVAYQRMAESGLDTLLQRMQLQTALGSKATGTTAGVPAVRSSIAPTTPSSPAGLAQANASVQSTFTQVEQLGLSFAAGKGPLSETEKQQWMESQTRLRDAATDLAAKVAQLPIDSPEREAARTQLTQVNDKLAKFELPVLARMNPEFGESWGRFHSTEKGSEGAALPKRMEKYGITDEQMQSYVTEGKESPGLTRAMTEARRTGEWPALGVTRAAYQMRADYLRATTSPEDAGSRKQAADLDAAATSLTKNRGSIHLNWASNTYARLATRYSDETTRPQKVQNQITEAKEAIASVGSHAAEQVQSHPERYGKNSATRRLAGDALSLEANIISTEAKASMDQEGKKLEETTRNQGDPKVVPPPPALHPDLAEGGAVDKKREAAVKVDPSLADVVHGGDRAVNFARDGMQTKKLRLSIDEQQVAHLASKEQDPPPQLVASVNKQLDSIFDTALHTNEKLTREKPGTLSIAQTQLLSETDTDLAVNAAKISSVERQKRLIESASDLSRFTEGSLDRSKTGLEKNFKAFEQQKLERVKGDVYRPNAGGLTDPFAINEFEKNPAAFAEKAEDTPEEAEARGMYEQAFREVGEQLKDARTRSADAKTAQDISKKIDDLDGLNNDPEMVTGLAMDAIKRSEAHLNVIPEKGPERIPRLQAAMDHKAAVVAVNTVVRDNADARITRMSLSHQQVQLVYGTEPPPVGIKDSVADSAENLAKTTAEGLQAKRDAFDAARAAGDASEKLRQTVGKELDLSQSKLSKKAQEQRAPEIQQYKDSLAVQQAQVQGSVAELGADIDPKESLAQLERGNEIVKKELPYMQVSRIGKKQAAIEHARNEARGNALAGLGEAGIAVADRAQHLGTIAGGPVVMDSLASAYHSAMDLRETLAIDGGGAAEATANKDFHTQMKDRAEAILNSESELEKTANAAELANKMDEVVEANIAGIDAQHKKLAGIVTDQREDSFGFLFNAGSEVADLVGMGGGDLNEAAVKSGVAGLDQAAKNAHFETRQIKNAAEQIRQMRANNIPDHVIMAALRDPRLAGDYMGPEIKEWQADFNAVAKRYGNFTLDNVYSLNDMRRTTALGKALETSGSNRTSPIVNFLGNKNTNLLSTYQSGLNKEFEKSEKKWADIAPWAMLSGAPDQVILAMGSSYALAGVFAKAASFTRIPQAFNAARGMAAGMSVPGRLAVLGGVNLAEAGLGMATGQAISGAGTGIFGEHSLGAKAFDVIGGGFQLSSGSAVAMRSGLGFQAAMGLTMHGVPVAAQQLGASPELAANIGTATGVFVPAVLGTMGHLKTLKRSEGVMVNELGIDPKQAKSLMGDIFHAESLNNQLDVESFTRERAAKILDARVPDLGKDARSTLLDSLTLDSVRKKLPFDPPKSATPQEMAGEVQNYYKHVERELIHKGVAPDQARQLAEADKTAIYQEALEKTNGSLGQEPPRGPGAGSTPGSSASSTRQALQQLANNTGSTLPEVQVLRTVRGQGVTTGQQVERGYKLLRMDSATNSAIVQAPNGSTKEVPANNVVFVHDNHSLGLLTPSARAQFENRLSKLSDDQKMEWSNMLGEANKKSPEHVQLLRQMLAGGSSMEAIKTWHERSMTLSQQELGAFVSSGTLVQHLTNSCVAACAQKMESILHPDRAASYRDPRRAALGQFEVLKRNQLGAERRLDKAYPHLDVPPMGSFIHDVAQPLNGGRPNALDAALTLENKSDYAVYDANNVDRRVLPLHLENLARGDGVIVHTGGTQQGTAYEIHGWRPGPNGNEVQVRTIGDPKGTWIRLSEFQPRPDGKIYMPDGKALTHVAVPPDIAMKSATKGMFLANDEPIKDMIRAATGKNITHAQIKGESALQAIHDSVQEMGFAGVGIEWKNNGTGVGHQLLVTGSHEKNGEFVFDVFDPTHGTTRPMSGKDLLNYTDGNIAGELTSVQVPDDLPIRASMPQGTSAERALASLQAANNPMEVDSALSATVPEFTIADAQTRESMINLILANPDPATRKSLLEIAPALIEMPQAANEFAMEHLNGMMRNDLMKTVERLQQAQPNWHRLSDEDAMKLAESIFSR